jgi:uncharacterized coiled-coil DUF342 family protein
MISLTPTQKAAIKSCLQEISNSMTRNEAERDNIREIVNRLHDEFEFNKRMSRKLARAFHKRSIEEDNAAQQELSEVYDAVVK